MNIWREPMDSRWLTILAVASVAATAVGFYLDVRCGLLVLGLGVLFWAGLVRILGQRVRRLENLNDEIDRALHGQDALNLALCQEGELSILQTQLHKLTVRLREQALKSRRDREQLSESLADISHQLRTPLTSLTLLGTMLGTGDAVRQRQLMGQLQTLLRRMDWLVEALLKLSKLDSGTIEVQREPVDAAAALRQAAEPLAVAMELREQRLTLCGTGGYIGDTAWTAEALGNILKNCMEHTPMGGEIWGTVTETALYTQIVIRDSGPGIDPADLPHLFERFYKGAKAEQGNFGIGLALAQRLIQAQNGTIRVQNAVQGGAEFVIRFYHSVV